MRTNTNIVKRILRHIKLPDDYTIYADRSYTNCASIAAPQAGIYISIHGIALYIIHNGVNGYQIELADPQLFNKLQEIIDQTTCTQPSS